VLVEAGHRCAIPTCKNTPVEAAHIKAREAGGPDSFENLIALCPTCHTRYDAGGIDIIAMRTYKANLGLVHSRYGDLEQRVLLAFAEAPNASRITLPGGLEILLSYLLRDGLLVKLGPSPGGNVVSMGVAQRTDYGLTQAGREFVDRYVGAELLEGDDVEEEPEQ
jgi:hypothetical protein